MRAHLSPFPCLFQGIQQITKIPGTYLSLITRAAHAMKEMASKSGNVSVNDLLCGPFRANTGLQAISPGQQGKTNDYFPYISCNT